jgi:hypothetical protein
MTKEEFLNEHCATFDNTGTWRVFSKDEKLSDLNEVIRQELITFCCEKLSPDIIGDEVIFVDEYLLKQQK